MIDLQKRQSEVIDAMRFPLIVLVVYIHILPDRLLQVQTHPIGYNAYVFLSELLSHSIGRIAVPCFFLFSGYFFFVKMGQWSIDFYRAQLHKRFKTLLLPYVIWITIAMVIGFAKYYLFDKMSIPQSDPKPTLSLQSLLQGYWRTPANYPLWYMRDLICMTLLSPLFYYLFRYFKVYGLIGILCSYLLQIESKVPGLSSTAILFFGAGAYFGIYRINLISLVRRTSELWVGLAILLPIIATLSLGRFTYYETLIRIFIPIGVLSALKITDKVTQSPHVSKTLRHYSSAVFFIYAVHKIFITDWIKGFFSRIPFCIDRPLGLLMAYFVMPFIILFICILLYKAWQRVSPRSLQFVLGGRSS